MKRGTILVVAAHPDDEVLGCGGTIARYADEGHDVHVLILAEGLTSRGAKRSRVASRSGLKRLAASAHAANEKLGTASVTLEKFPDNRMDSVDLLDVVKTIESAVHKLKPHTLLTHFGGDVNIDHRVLHDAVMAACRPLPGHPVRRLLFFEAPSSTEWRAPGLLGGFCPNFFLDISAYLPRKLEALGAYSSELRAFPHARSIEAVEALARWRGATVGFRAAEAFMAGRIID